MPFTDRQLAWLKERLHQMKEDLLHRLDGEGDEATRNRNQESGKRTDFSGVDESGYGKLDLKKAEQEYKMINRILKRLETGEYDKDSDKTERIRVQQLFHRPNTMNKKEKKDLDEQHDE